MDERLKELPDDFTPDRIYRCDAKELLEIINQVTDNKIKAWLYLRWNESSKRSARLYQERVYEKIRGKLNVSIEILDEELINYCFSGALMDEKIEQPLEALKSASPSFKYQINKDLITICKTAN